MKIRLLFFFICLSTAVLWAMPPLAGEAEHYPRRQRVKRPEQCQPLRRSPQQFQSVGDKNIAPRGLLILVEFQDVAFLPENNREAFDSLANAVNYTYDGAIGSTREYFRAQSDGQYVPTFDVVGPVVLPYKMAYYGANDDSGLDINTGDFLMQAVQAADLLGVDFTRYDNDRNGYIDFVYIIYAGYGEADTRIANTIWPHNWDLMSNLYYGCTQQNEYYYRSENDYKLPQYDGLFLNDYACSACLRKDGMRSGIGTFSHEFGHVLGLPDYYPDNTKAGYISVLPYTPGSWSIMGYGCYINGGRTPCNYSAFDKYYLGWLTPSIPQHGDTITLSADNTTAYMITKDGLIPPMGAETPDTVYYLENRQYDGWDTYLPGHGLLVWRVIYSDAAWRDNLPNNDTLIGYTLLTADHSTPYNTSTMGGQHEGVPFPGRNDTMEAISTQLTLFDKYQLQDIQEQDGVISFRFVDLNQATPTENIEQSHYLSPTKAIVHRQMVIYRNNRMYDLQGREIH